MDQLITFYSV